MFETYFREGCLLVMVISGLPLAIGAGVGLLVAVIQTATQIQEQSITYVVKLSAVSATVVLLWNWASAELLRFLQQAFESFISLGRG